MDETVEGSNPEETARTPVADEATAAGDAVSPPPEPPAPPPPKPPYYQRPVERRDWLLIALVAVSTIAVLLLVATVVLAVTHDGACGRPGWSDERGPMMRRMPGLGENGPGKGLNRNDKSGRGDCGCEKRQPEQRQDNTPAPPQSAPQQPAQ